MHASSSSSSMVTAGAKPGPLQSGGGPSSGLCEAGPSYAGRRQSRPDTQQVCEPALIGYFIIFIQCLSIGFHQLVLACRLKYFSSDM